MLTLLYIFLGLVFLKIILNGSRYFETRHYFKVYQRYLRAREDESDTEIVKSKARIINLFKGAGIKDSPIPFVQPVGYGKLLASDVSAFDNIHNLREDVVGKLTMSFYEALGIYQQRTKEAINPLFWIETVITLPRVVLSYVGISGESVVTKVFQVLWWFIGVVLGLLYAIYRPNLEVLIRGYIEGLLK